MSSAGLGGLMPVVAFARCFGGSSPVGGVTGHEEFGGLFYPERLPEKPEALVVLLHGYGADAPDLLDIARLFSPVLPGAAFYLAQAPLRCETHPSGRAWFPLPNLEKATIRRGLRGARSGMVSLLEALAQTLGLGPGSVVLFGFSQGAMVALDAGLSGAAPLGGIVAHSGLWLGVEGSGSGPARQTPALLLHGGSDAVVSPLYLEPSRAALEILNVPVRAKMFPSLGHGINAESCDDSLRFLRECLRM